MLWLFLLLVDKGQRFQIVIEDLGLFCPPASGMRRTDDPGL